MASPRAEPLGNMVRGYACWGDAMPRVRSDDGLLILAASVSMASGNRVTSRKSRGISFLKKIVNYGLSDEIYLR